jgi:peptidoglycan hydrolase-like protein with peptidoglycan-binding domain
MPTDWKHHFQNTSRKPRKKVSFGVDSSTVKKVQNILNQLGATPPLVEDGVFGPKSQAALKRFQSVNGLTVDGSIGSQVLQAMGLTSQSSPSTIDTITSTVGSAIDGIQQSVIDAFMSFTGNLEGSMLPYMYTDRFGLVTMGSGNLIDDSPRSDPNVDSVAVQPWIIPARALNKPWKRKDGSPVTRDEIRAAWNVVKGAWPGIQSVESQHLTEIRLPKTAIQQTIDEQLKSNHEHLRAKYPGYVNWPADAQLGLHSMAWAMGPEFQFPQFTAAVNKTKPDFVTAASASHMSNGAVERNNANKQLFLNAADAQAKKANYSKLFYPGPVIAGAIGLFGTFIAGLLGVAGFLGYKRYKKTGRILP